MSANQSSIPQQGAPQTPVPLQAGMPPISQQQEDSIIHTRITNDEKSLRKVTKKFYHYTSVAYNGAVPVSPESSTSIDDARDAFLLDLASFNLSLKKSLMVCEAEARQIEEYQRERERIESEHESLSGQIESLKVSLEQAHLQRRRKIEYDVIAERINTLPSREELEQSITAIENDMLAIQAEHENQNNILQAQQAALETVISSIQDLRRLGKEDVDLNEASHTETPAPESQLDGDHDIDMEPRARAETGEIPDDTDEVHEMNPLTGSAHLSKSLNPAAKAFIPTSSSPSTPLLRSSAGTPLPASDSQNRSELEEGEDDDIEMGELAEEPSDKGKKAREELEEGEASDLSSELSEPPDD